MNNASTQALGVAIAEWINEQDIPCFYEGIRAQCAIDLRVAPNNPRFHAAWDRVCVWITGPGNIGAQWIE